MMGTGNEAKYVLEIRGETTRKLLRLAKIAFHSSVKVAEVTALSFEEAMRYLIEQTGLPFVLGKEE